MNNNKVPKIISFIFPLIGLIIYAVNVGKNDILAKDCLKYALYGLSIPIIIIIIILIIPYIAYIFNKNNIIDNNRNENYQYIEQNKMTKAEKNLILTASKEFYINMSNFYDFDKKNTITINDLFAFKYISNIDYENFKQYGIYIKINKNNNDVNFEIVYE